MTILKNIVTDFGAVGNGVADDAPKFNDFNTWALANQGSSQIVLTVPAGTYLFNSGDVNSNSWAKGVKDLIVSGAGRATTTLKSGATSFFFLGALGQVNDNAHSARVATVVAGSNTVTLLTLSDNSRFSVGSWALMAGLCLQADGGGYPSNPHWFEYVLITAIDTGTGVITFSSALEYSYKSTWPLYDAGGPSNVDQGGPATLYALDASWNCTHKYTDLLIDQPTLACRAMGRDIWFVNVDSTDQLYPSVNNSWRVTNCVLPGGEVDKLVRTITIDGGSTVGTFITQSSSCDLTSVDSSTVHFTGTTKRFVAANSNVTFIRPGPIAYGAGDVVALTNCVVSTVDYPGGVLEKSTGNAGINNSCTMAAGVIKIPASLNAPRWAVPGKTCFWSGQFAIETQFRIVDVWRDASFTYIQTSLTGGFPTLPLSSGGLFIQCAPAPVCTFSGCTGSAEAIDLSQPGATGKPIWQYSNRTYTGNSALTAHPVWGQIVSTKINVIQAYTGVQNPLRLELSQDVVKADGTSYIYDAFIDLRTTGLRTITNAGVTGSAGADATLALTGLFNWFADNVQIGISAVISGESSSVWPIVSVEIVTDQGITDLATTGTGKVMSFSAGGNMLMKRGRH